ncbi:hypothetical protein [Paraburkholderia aromaticivorans]|uniref:hypothetical protein n=1 Tax=Paraburkholderia aromaticivorans TaxID=2026199 RepID=UPI0038B98E49
MKLETDQNDNFAPEYTHMGAILENITNYYHCIGSMHRSDIMHFHGHYIDTNEIDTYALDEHTFLTYGYDSSKEKYELIDINRMKIGELSEKSLGDALDRKDVYSYEDMQNEKKVQKLGLKHKDVIRDLYTRFTEKAQEKGEYDYNYHFNVLHLAEDKLKNDHEFMLELLEKYPLLVDKHHLSEELQHEIGDNDPIKYLKAKANMQKIELTQNQQVEKKAEVAPKIKI